jgi:hypothetical protein
MTVLTHIPPANNRSRIGSLRFVCGLARPPSP